MAKAIYFIQKPFTVDTEQIGCYYFNILQAVELCRKHGAAIVPPQLPLCPRDNKKVEFNSTDHWSSSILAIGSVDSRRVLDYSQVASLSFEEFCRQSNHRVKMEYDGVDISGISFTADPTSKYVVLDLPPRWDLQGKDPLIFYNELYPILPLRLSLIEGKIPEWYTYYSKSCFLGVHWRRGDRGNAIMGAIGKRLWASTEPEAVGKYINQYLKKHPEITWVYVSTNSGSFIDRRALSRIVEKPLYYFEYDYTVPPLEIWKWDLTDLMLCAKAKHLILSPGGLERSSAFGRLMYAECLRQNPEDALVSFMPMV